MSYKTRIVGHVVRVTSSRTGEVHDYAIPPGVKPEVYALRCAERVRVGECLDAIRIRDHHHRRMPHDRA